MKVDAVDTTGAGDAFVAGILSQLAGDLSLLQVLLSEPYSTSSYFRSVVVLLNKLSNEFSDDFFPLNLKLISCIIANVLNIIKFLYLVAKIVFKFHFL